MNASTKPNPAIEHASKSAALLVSIRSLEEMRLVAGLGIDVLDFKEPHRGPLAPASPELWHQAAVELPSDCRLSAALGEWDGACEVAGLVPSRFAYAKAGPAGVPGVAPLAASWTHIGGLLAPGIELVAVAYADHQSAQCPAPEAIFQAAANAGIRTWLLDTYDKSQQRDSLAQLGIERLAGIQRLAQRADARWVLAGSIHHRAARELHALGIGPTMFGVRGDVCEGSRGGLIVPAKIRRWLDLLRTLTQDEHQGDDCQRGDPQA